MRTFVRHYILPVARKLRWQNFCEIGARDGTSTNYFLKLPIASYTVIDPCLDEDLHARYAGDARVRVVKSNSLDALADGGPIRNGTLFDCILIDGDHNWYTVFNELRVIHKRGLLRAGGFIFLHDVDWPYGRRDLYYQPETIPAEFRHPYAQQGVVRGQDSLSLVGGWNHHLMNAVHEGGARNGVMTAIEDFLAQRANDYRFFWIRYQWGLGVLQRRTEEPADRAAFQVLQAKARYKAPISRLSRKLKFVLKGRKES